MATDFSREDDLLTQIALLTRQRDEARAAFCAEQEARLRAEETLRQRQSLLREIIDYAPQSITVQDLAAGRYLLANRRQAMILGREVDEIVGKTLAELVPKQADYWREEDRQIAASGEPRQIEDRKRHADGGDQYFLGTKFPVRDRTGEIYAIGCIFQDITARKVIERALQESEERYRSVVAALEEGVIALDDTGQINAINPSAARLLGIVPEQALGQPFAMIHPPAECAFSGTLCGEDHPALVTLRTGRPNTGVLLQVHAVGLPPRWIAVNAQPRIAPGEQHAYGVVCSLADVTARRTLEEDFRHRATHDSLTTLPNRAGFLAALGRALTPEMGPPATVAVLFLDLDHFKAVNVRFGHECGDELLIAVAERIKASLRGAAVGARLGGDEFTACLPHLDTPEQATRVARQLLHNLRLPFQLGDHEVQITPSIGIAIGRAGHHSPGELLRRADAALYRAKGRGRAQYDLASTTAPLGHKRPAPIKRAKLSRHTTNSLA